MPINKTIQYADINNFRLDPKNPRLGRENTEKDLTQDQILALMSNWTLDELAISFLESGFWPQEALIVILEENNGVKYLTVVEGNRRLAALKNLFRAHDGTPLNKKWAEIAASTTDKEIYTSLSSLPYITVDSRGDVQAYLGFRHVTGIKEWKPAEKAEYIAKLIDEKKMSYPEVMRKIGSKVPSVRQNYISYRLLLQMQQVDEIALEKVEERFSVLYLSLRSSGVQGYLGVDINAEPGTCDNPVPMENYDKLANFALWLFGSKDKPALITDSRDVDKFGAVLSSQNALEYILSSTKPNFDTAYRLAGGDEAEVVDSVKRAAVEIEQALSRAHHHVDSVRLQDAVRRFAKDAIRLLDNFPLIKKEVTGI